MEELQRNIDKVFRESLSDYREAPPPGAWSQVSRRLDEEDRGRRGMFLRWPWIMLSLLMVMGCAWIVVGLSLRGRVEEKNLPAAATAMAMPAAPAVQTPKATPQALHALPDDEDSKDILTSNTEAHQPVKIATKEARKHNPFLHRTAISNSTTPVANENRTSDLTSGVASANGTSNAATQQVASASAPAQSVPQAITGTNVSARHHRDALRPLPHTRRMRLLSAKHATLKAPEMLPRHKADFPTLSVAKAARNLPGPANNHTTASIAHSTKGIKAGEASPAVAGPQPAHVWQKPAPQRIGKLAITKKKAPLSHDKLSTPGALPQASAPVVADVSAAPKEAPQQQQTATERLTAKPQNIRRQAEPALIPAAKSGAAIRVTYPDPPPVFATAPPAAQLPLPQATPASVPADTKGNVDTALTAATVNDALQEPHKPRMKPPFSLALLGGYEQKMQSGAQGQFSLAARLSWQLNNSVSIGVQPAFRYSQLPSRTVGKDAAYQRSAWRIDSFRTTDISPTIAGKLDDIYNYVIHQIYDSIVIRSRSMGGAFWEIELPVMVRCRLTNSWSVWGGPSVVFGGKLSYTGDGAPQVYFTERKDSIAQSVQKPKEEFLNYFGTSSLPEYSTYKPSDEPEQAALLRLGYMAGIGYNHNRWLMEASLHGQLTGYQNLAQSAQDVYAHPNVRISVGYLLFSEKKRGGKP